MTHKISLMGHHNYLETKKTK